MRPTARELVNEESDAVLANTPPVVRWLLDKAMAEGAILLPAIERRPRWTWSTRGGDVEADTATELAVKLGYAL